MKKVDKSETATLRQKAEELLKKHASKAASYTSENDIRKLNHELQVYQIELEILNEELILANEHANSDAEKYIDLYDFAPSGYFTLSKEGQIIGLNLKGASMLGKERQRLINNRLGLFISDDTKPIFNLFLNKVFKGNGYETCEVTISGEGKSVPTYFYLSGNVIKNGKQCQITMVNITEQKQTEKSLQKSEERFQLLFNKAPLGYQSLDIDGIFIEVNQQWLDTLGYTRDEVIGKWFVDFLSPAYQDGFRKRFPIFKSQGHIHSEFEMVQKNGNKLFIAFEGRIGYNNNGEFKQTHCILQDITERKVLEENLRNNESYLKETQAIANLGTYTMDIKSGKWTSSEILDKIFGIDTNYDKSVEGWASLIHPEWQNIMTDYFINEVISNKTKFDKEYKIIRHSDKVEKWVHGIGNLKFDENDQPITMIGTIQDITERKKAEETLRENERKFRELFEANMDGITILTINQDPKDVSFFDMNENSAKMLGYTKEEMFKMHPSSLEKHVTKEEVEKRIEDFKLKGFLDFETIFRHKNGNEIVVEIKTKVINYNNQPAVMNIVRDITERKQTELALIKAKEQAEESDRLKSAFLTNMSHEIRTPMNGILGFTELLKDPNLSTDDQQDFIQTIQISGERMLNTINNIVDVSKIESGLINVVIDETNINKKIEFTFKFFKPEVEKKGLQFIYKNGLPTEDAVIRTDNEKVYGVLTNLIKNAIKFTYNGSIEFGYNIIKTQYSVSLQFYVKDTGVGIPKNQQQTIFERFRQGNDDLNRLYEGSGLGLSISKSYVEMLGGKIWVDSEEGKGSTFYFTIPYHSVKEEKTEIKGVDSSEIKEVQMKNLKILIVEDDEISYSLLKRTIQKIGKEVLHAITGVEAIEACRSNPDLDLILMDIRMPIMDGCEATRQIRQFNKDVIIIAQTAYAFAGDSEIAKEAGCNDYISKPINMTFLFELIKKHCNS